MVVIPHSMGFFYFLHFMMWVEKPGPMGDEGSGGPYWCAKHLKVVTNIRGPFLIVPKAFSILFPAEAKDLVVARSVAPGVVDNEIFGRHTLQHLMCMTHA